MNEHNPISDQAQFTPEQLRHLMREGDPPLTRREIRMRERAVEAGLLRWEGERLVIADPTPQRQMTSQTQEPPIVTSADVLAGKVPAASGLTRRQLRELAAQEAEVAPAPSPQPQEEPQAAPVPEPQPEPEPQRETTLEQVDAPVLEDPPHGEGDAPAAAQEAATRRPVVRPQGANTGEYTGEFDRIRQAMADINAAPETPPEVSPTGADHQAQQPAQAPARRSVFQATVPEALQGVDSQPESPAEQTDAADWTAVINNPTVTDDVLPEVEEAEPVTHPSPEPGQEQSAPEEQPAQEQSNSSQGAPVKRTPRRVSAKRARSSQESGSVPVPGDEKYNFPDWHTLTSIPTVENGPASSNSFTHASSEGRQKTTPVWLTILQWLVIAAVAVVLGVLVWYAINRGFGGGSDEAWGIITPAHYLRI